METPGVMSALRPGTDRQREEEPRAGGRAAAPPPARAAEAVRSRWQPPGSAAAPARHPPFPAFCQRWEGSHPGVRAQGAARGAP